MAEIYEMAYGSSQASGSSVTGNTSQQETAVGPALTDGLEAMTPTEVTGGSEAGSDAVEPEAGVEGSDFGLPSVPASVPPSSPHTAPLRHDSAWSCASNSSSPCSKALAPSPPQPGLGAVRRQCKIPEA